jgi:transcriptional regulator with XRE-family HTH domain
MPKKQTATQDDMKKIAARLFEARTLAGISQRELSKRINVTQPLISAWEQGRSVPSLHHIVAIESALELDKTTLLFAIAYGDQNA